MIIDSYRILEEIGRGGMGVVYKARDERFGRLVALKVLTERMAGQREALQRFEREGRAASGLQHSNICAVYEAGHSGEHAYIAMELLEGETLKERLSRGALDLRQTVDLGCQMAAALEAAHARYIIHRDIKPSNIFLTGRGAKLVDFGLAKMLRQHAMAGAATVATAQMTLVTRPGTVLGTLAYMSPEQARGEPLDARTDIYSLGVVLYECAAGRLPSQGGGVPQPLAPVVARATALKREARWQTARELRQALSAILS